MKQNLQNYKVVEYKREIILRWDNICELKNNLRQKCKIT